MTAPHRPMLVVLGNQLFPLEHLEPHKDAVIFMAEDVGLCTYVRHHQQKIVLFLAAMRAYRDELIAAGFDVRYTELEPDSELTYEDRLGAAIDDAGATQLHCFEIEDRPMEARLADLAATRELDFTVLRSPMFVTSREYFADYISSVKRPFMADFYKRQRKRLDILLTADGDPVGGRWSFDDENRKKLPRSNTPPDVPVPDSGAHVAKVRSLVSDSFSAHPGDANDFWWPTTREQALDWLDDFLVQRLRDFGPYEDAMTTRSATVYHSVLSPLLNIGLLTPDEVVHRALEVARANDDVPLASLEGFVRQIVGWREFIRGIYRHYDDAQANSNFWGHERQLTDAWYTGDTGIPPLDDTIRTALRLGWTHHIPRLMVAANLMTLCEVHPKAAWRWFMEMYVDSSEWVMGPNVWGMGLFSDGGVFATKPYICGSNYMLKMSDYRKGEWCDVVDGLYWRFIDRHREFFSSQPRLALMTRALDRLKDDRRDRIFAAAEGFIGRVTQ